MSTAALDTAIKLPFPAFHATRVWAGPWLKQFEATLTALGVPRAQWHLALGAHLDPAHRAWYDALLLTAPDATAHAAAAELVAVEAFRALANRRTAGTASAPASGRASPAAGAGAAMPPLDPASYPAVRDAVLAGQPAVVDAFLAVANAKVVTPAAPRGGAAQLPATSPWDEHFRPAFVREMLGMQGDAPHVHNEARSKLASTYQGNKPLLAHVAAFRGLCAGLCGPGGADDAEDVALHFVRSLRPGLRDAVLGRPAPAAQEQQGAEHVRPAEIHDVPFKTLDEAVAAAVAAESKIAVHWVGEYHGRSRGNSGNSGGGAQSPTRAGGQQGGDGHGSGGRGARRGKYKGRPGSGGTRGGGQQPHEAKQADPQEGAPSPPAASKPVAEATPKPAAEATPKPVAEATPKPAAEATPKQVAEPTPKQVAEPTQKAAGYDPMAVARAKGGSPAHGGRTSPARPISPTRGQQHRAGSPRV